MNEVRCRVKRLNWVLVPPVGLACGWIMVLPFQTMHEQPHSSLWTNFLVCGATAAALFGLVLYMVRSLLFEQVIANEEGLRWRGAFGGWKCARWDDISDFYLLGKVIKYAPVQTNTSAATPTVETLQGKLKLERALAHLGEMMNFIAAHSTNAPSREWEIYELRATQNFSQRFEYWTKTQKWLLPTVLGALAICCAGQL